MDNPIISILQARKATRSISDKPLPENVIADLIEAVRLTPSCFNNQPWKYLFLETNEPLEKGRQALSKGNFAWASRAPLLVVGYAKRDHDCVLPDGRAYYQFDLGMSAMNLMLCATHYGLVARPMAGYDPSKIIELFDLEETDEPLIMVAIGYPSDDENHLPDRYKGVGEKPRTRKDVEDIAIRL